jgi:SSS family solute:Na+ symporter
LTLARDLEARGAIKPEQMPVLEERLQSAFAGADTPQKVEAVRAGIDPASVVLQAARDIGTMGFLGLIVGLLLLGAACAVVLSTGMNYLLSPSSNIIRDIYQRFMKPDAEQKRAVALQKVFIVILGTCAFLMIFIPTILHSRISVLRYAYFAYTMYGVAVTPALIAALAWKRATKFGGISSIVSGALCALVLELVIPNVWPQVMKGGDPWGVPSVYPSIVVSLLFLVVGSFLTRKPGREQLQTFFPAKA